MTVRRIELTDTGEGWWLPLRFGELGARALIDTGATSSCISPAEVERLGLKPAPPGATPCPTVNGQQSRVFPSVTFQVPGGRLIEAPMRAESAERVGNA